MTTSPYQSVSRRHFLQVAGGLSAAAGVCSLRQVARGGDLPCAGPGEAAAYPLSGYWLYGRPGEASWRSALQRISRLGADTVIQFGSRPVRKTEAQIREHPLLSQCRFSGDAGQPPRRIYVFETQENFGPALLARPGVDQRAEVGDKIVWRLVFPVDAPAQPATAAASGETYDLVYVTGRKQDSVRDLLTVAGACACRVFVGMPCATPDPRYPWDPDASAFPALKELTRRILKDYAERYGGRPAFAGVYQSLETPVSKTCLKAVLAAYRLQHALVRAILPGKQILVSPYWDARKKNSNGTDIAEIKAGIMLLARQEVDIIAPQDSRGTGKVGLFWPDQAAEPVDERLEPAVGKLTYGEAYFANTTAFYRAAREGLDEVAAREGLRVALWANVEAFEPVAAEASSRIKHTTQERLEQAIMFAGIYPSRLISFMWDEYFTGRGGRSLSLAEEIEASGRRPLIVHAQVEQAANGRTLVVWGYDLEGAEAELAFQDAAGVVQTVKAALTKPPQNARTRIAHPLPERLQAAGLAFDVSRLPRGSSVSITAGRQGLRSFHAYRLETDRE